jgi:hypothetical protein
VTLVLNLPQDVDERLQRDAEQKGVAKEALAVDIIARSVSSSDSQQEATYSFWDRSSFEELATAQGIEPVRDFQQWLASLPKVEGADELVEHIEQARRERREVERSRP